MEWAMATACFCGVPSFTRREILSLIFCFRDRRTFDFLATTSPVSVVGYVVGDTTAEPSSQFKGGLLPVEPMSPPGGPRLERLG